MYPPILLSFANQHNRRQSVKAAKSPCQQTSTCLATPTSSARWMNPCSSIRTLPRRYAPRCGSGPTRRFHTITFSSVTISRSSSIVFPRVSSVSYTHLDVYKRQDIRIRLGSIYQVVLTMRSKTYRGELRYYTFYINLYAKNKIRIQCTN